MRLKMGMKHCLASVATMALIMATVPAMAYTGQELSKQAKVSIAEARAIALKAHPGKITDEELEKEKGGTGLRYSFDIKRGAVTQEVGVDAQTGKDWKTKRKAPIQTRSQRFDRLKYLAVSREFDTHPRQGRGGHTDRT